MPQSASGQSEINDRPRSIEESLIDSLAASAQLRQALVEQRTQRADLEKAYVALKAQLSSSNAELQTTIAELQRQLLDSTQRSADLEAEITRLMGLLSASKAESDSLSMAFDSYQREMQKQVADVTRAARLWKAGAIAGWIVAIIAIIVAVVL